MKSTVEPAEGNKVKVAVEIDEAELEPAVEAAWREIAKEVRLPGFRPGKAPRKLLEKQLGSDYARSEALRSAVRGRNMLSWRMKSCPLAQRPGSSPSRRRSR